MSIVSLMLLLIIALIFYFIFFKKKKVLYIPVTYICFYNPNPKPNTTMSPPWSTFSLSVKRTLNTKTRTITLGLYRSLLRISQKFDNEAHQTFLWNTIRERFRFELHNHSRAQTLTLLLQGEKALDLLRIAQGGNQTYLKRIDAMVTAKIGPLEHVARNLRKIQHVITTSSPQLIINSVIFSH
ncbi:hypothetical protein CLU79DRAFT_489781 [Phycomyces nitens]|nr:hypothetical protein CLU79DRAFT_489781 [Phycomyces nitens]